MWPWGESRCLRTQEAFVLSLGEQLSKTVANCRNLQLTRTTGLNLCLERRWSVRGDQNPSTGAGGLFSKSEEESLGYLFVWPVILKTADIIVS